MRVRSQNFIEIRTKIEKRKLWPYIEANKVLKRHNYDLNHLYTFESGFGPSGFPHIGTFGEVVRTEFIINALKEFGFKTKLIVFSDDLDGLRKVPEGMPEWLKNHLGKPVSKIPDPYGECSSFSEYMNNKLKDMLKWMEIDYYFKSSKETYENGEFDDAIKILLRNYRKLEEIIAPTLSKETLKNWHPFFPICEECGKVLTTVVKEVNLEDNSVQYSCTKNHGEISGCGYEGLQTALKGHGKMTWRVDWPLRWYALGVDYELYGKDLIESFIIGKKIMNRIFQAKEPENMFYEMFLDEDGTKISKSKGKGLTVEEWLRYGIIESLYLLIYRKPQKAKELSFKIIPSYVDDIVSISKDYHKDPHIEEHEFNFITNFHAKEKKIPDISYMLICNLMTALKSDDKELIKEYLSKQKGLTNEHLTSNFLNDLIGKAGRFYQDFISDRKHEIAFSNEDIFCLGQFVGLLYTELTAEKIHNSVYEIAQRNKIKPQHFFKIIYLALIEQDRGPRLGSFVKMIGQDKIIEIISGAVKLFLDKTKEDIALQDKLMPTINDVSGFPTEITQESSLENVGFKTPTKKLYYVDPYQKDFKTIITKIDGDRLFLNHTCFYPKSGGQVGDTGIIGSQKVIETFYENNDIAHRVENVDKFVINQELECSIDWERRYKIMKLHSASHIMEYFLFQLVGRVQRLGSIVNENSDRSTYQATISSEQMSNIERHVNEFIQERHEIDGYFTDEEKDLRMWRAGEITDNCGGTHPKNTIEIGKVVIQRKSGGKGITKISTKLVE